MFSISQTNALCMSVWIMYHVNTVGGVGWGFAKYQDGAWGEVNIIIQIQLLVYATPTHLTHKNVFLKSALRCCSIGIKRVKGKKVKIFSSRPISSASSWAGVNKGRGEEGDCVLKQFWGAQQSRGVSAGFSSYYLLFVLNLWCPSSSGLVST